MLFFVSHIPCFGRSIHGMRIEIKMQLPKEISPAVWHEKNREAHPADEKHLCSYAFVDYVAVYKRQLQHADLFRPIPATDTPFLRIKIISPVADILHKTQRNISISAQNIPARGCRRHSDSLFPQISDCLFITHRLGCKNILPKKKGCLSSTSRCV